MRSREHPTHDHEIRPARDWAAALCKRQWKELVKHAGFALGERGDRAEDIAEIALCKLATGELDLPAGTEAETLSRLRGVVSNLAKHVHRDEGKFVTRSDGAERPAGDDPFSDAWTAELRERIEKAFEYLTRREAQLAWLHWYEQWTVPELARRFGITPKTVKELLRRARRKLRVALAAVWRVAV